MSALTTKIEIDINGNSYEEYNFLNIVLSQEVLRPNELRFTMQKKENIISAEDAYFETPRDIIGSKLNLSITTERYNERGEDVLYNILTLFFSNRFLFIAFNSVVEALCITAYFGVDAFRKLSDMLELP